MNLGETRAKGIGQLPLPLATHLRTDGKGSPAHFALTNRSDEPRSRPSHKGASGREFARRLAVAYEANSAPPVAALPFGLGFPI